MPLLLALLALLAACAGAGHAPVGPLPGAMPALRLAPSALPGGLALQQRLTFRHGERRDTVDALVESDALQTRLVIHSQGQVALRLVWDGQALDEQRSPGVPAALRGERVLDDLQLVFWPAVAISAALPAGWTLVEQGKHRELRDGAEVVVSVDRPAAGMATLRQYRQGYELEIESQPVSK